MRQHRLTHPVLGPAIWGEMAALTRRQLAVLRKMRDEDEELVYEHGIAYVGLERISSRTVFALLRAVAIRMDTFSEVGRGTEYYSISDNGLQALRGTAPSGPAVAHKMFEKNQTSFRECGKGER